MMPMPTYTASAVPLGAATAGIENAGADPVSAMCAPRAAVLASATGMRERARYSKRRSSIASRAALTGAENVADMPAAAPAETRRTWPTNDPSAPPVAMIGPPAPKGPPVPMEIAAERGSRNVIRAGIRLSLKSTCSIASRMPCPRIAEGGVDAERIAVWLAGEAALGAGAHALVLHPLGGDLGGLRVGPDLEREEVGEVETSGSLQPAENLVGRSGEAQIDVPSGPGAVEAKLEDEPSLQRGRVAQDGDHPRQEAIEHQELAPTGEDR